MATAALWTEQRPLFGDWATETRQGVSWGGGGGGDVWVAPSGMAQFCANGRRCVQRSIGKGRLWTEKRPLNGDWAAETRHCVSRGVGVAGLGGLRLAAWCNSGDHLSKIIFGDTVKTAEVWCLTTVFSALSVGYGALSKS